jgi:EamA-like transporter family
VLIFTPWHTTGGLFPAGGLECLAASIRYAVSYIYMDRFLARRGIGPVVLSACQLAAAAVMLAIALAVSGAPTPHVTAGSVAAIAVLGIIGTGFAYVLNYQILRGSDRRLDGDLPAAGGRDRARHRGPGREHHCDRGRRYCPGPAGSGPDTPPDETS